MKPESSKNIRRFLGLRRDWLLLFGIVVFNLIFNILKFPRYILGGEIWAEAATNYFPNSKSNSLSQIFLSTDAGYVPLFLRIVSFFFARIQVPLNGVPYAYTYTAIVLSAVAVGIFVLNRFRLVIKSDFTRLIIVILILVSANFEFRTYINFTYYGAIFSFMVALSIFFKVETRTFLFFLPFAIIAKPINLAVIPALILILIVKPDISLRSKIAIYCASVFGMIQIIFMFSHRTEYLIVYKFSILTKAIHTLIYFFGFLSSPLSILFKPNYIISVLFGILILFCSLFFSKKDKQQLILVTISLVTIFSTVLINCFAVTGLFTGGQYTLISSTNLNKYLTNILDLYVIFIALILEKSWPRKINRIQKKKTPSLLQSNPRNLVLFSLSLAIIFVVPRVSEPSYPTTSNSLWQKNIEDLKNKQPICFPVDPIGWYYSSGCVRVKNGIDATKYLGFSTKPIFNGKILVPNMNTHQNNLLGFSFPARIETENSSGKTVHIKIAYHFDNGLPDYIDNSNLNILSHGNVLLFKIPKSVAKIHIQSVELSFSEAVFTAQILNSINVSGAMPADWYAII